MVYVFDVVTAIIHPVPAKPGQCVVVAPGTDHPVLVVERGTSRVVREGPPNYGALAGLISDGVLVMRPLPESAQRTA